MRKVLATLALVLALCFAIPSHAQTTYLSETPFYCDMASAQPLTSFTQFSCRGITYKNPDGTTALQYYFQGGIPRNWVDLYQTSPLIYGQGTVTEVTTFTLPNPLRPKRGSSQGHDIGHLEKLPSMRWPWMLLAGTRVS
jgi:hypothetical protein